MTLFLSHPDCLAHVTPPGHPERVGRLQSVLEATAGLDLQRQDLPLAADDDLRLCHPQRYVDFLRDSIPEAGIRQIEQDTHVSPGSFTAALRAAGGCVAAVDAVLDGRAQTAFVAGRPPGHHALADAPMGFCLFGNVAIAAKHALDRRGLSRVAIVDFDVHHGNGTQALVWDDARILFVSSHQAPFYPGSGSPQERGAHGQVLNMPLRAGTGGDEMRHVYRAQAFPALEAFGPELVLVSAGFDAHADDPLGGLNWREDDFAWLTRQLRGIARGHAQGRIVSTLEGGYDLAALGASVAAHLAELEEPNP